MQSFPLTAFGVNMTLQRTIFICFLACSAAFADREIICRYCEWNEQLSAMPRGIELEGRYHYAPDRQVDVLHIKIDVTPDFDKRSVSGTTTIKARVLAKPCALLRLDATNLQVAAVRCDGAEVEDFYSTRKDLQINFSDPVAVDKEITVEIDYSAEPARGLYFRTAEMGYPESDTHIWTQGEPHEARHWFPCFDYPNERSSTEVICHVPRDMTVLSNGKRMGEEPDGDLKAVRWLQEKPHVSYLICLVAGHLEKLQKQHRDIELGFFTQPSLAKYAKNSFEDTTAIMAFFEEEIGVPYPWEKYYQVTCADFVAGGMENTSLTTLTQGTLFSQATENLRTTRRLDAHEMAHQWFGDYVTCKDWSHLWLNEGFATFYTHLYEGHKFGRDAMLFGLYEDARGRVLAQEKDTKPIVFREYKNPREQFDYRAYPKGSWVLHMLRCQLGEELYRKCIKTYVETHALDAVTTEDLRKTIEDLSGRPMDRFFDQWVYHGRHPELKIAYRWMPSKKLAKVSVKQTQEITDDVMKFEFPTKLRFVVDGAAVDHEIRIKDIEEDFYVPLEAKPSIVRFDPEYTVLAKVSFEKSDELWKAQLLDNKDDVIGRVLAADALAERKTGKSVEMLSAALNEDPFFGVRMSAAHALSVIATDEAYEALSAAQDQPDARVRNDVIYYLTHRFHEDTPELLNEVLENEKNPEIKSKAIDALGLWQGAKSRKLLLRYLQSESYHNQLASAAISAIRKQRDATFRAPLMNVLEEREDEFWSRDFRKGLTTLAEISANARNKDDVRRFLTRYLNHPKTRVRGAAMEALGKLGDEKAAAILETYAESDDEDQKKMAGDALKALHENAAMAPKEVVEMRKELLEMKKSQETMRKQWEELRKQMEASEKNDEEIEESKTEEDQ